MHPAQPDCVSPAARCPLADDPPEPRPAAPAVATSRPAASAREPERIDAGEDGRWTATLPTSVTGLALLEPNGKRRLFVTTTLGGELHVLDADGRLRYSAALPGSEATDEMHCFGLEAGAFADDSWAIWMNLGSDCYLYRLNAIGLERGP